MLIDFKDAVTASNLDPAARYAVFYMDGRFANRAAVARRCPHAKLFGITVTGLVTGVGVFAVDSETGDVPVAGTLAWLEKQIRLGVHHVHPICAYANEDRWLNEGLLLGVVALEKKYGVEIEKWDAHYDGIREIPAWASAKQYADPGPVDLDVALASFFGDVVDPHYAWFDTKRRVVAGGAAERATVQEYDRLRATQTRTRHPHRARLAVLRVGLRLLAGRLWTIAHTRRPPAWGRFRRGWRREELIRRAQGERIV